MNEATKGRTRKAIGDAAFSVSARVAIQLGRESISSSIVALLELVKNSYDADAENIYLAFKDLGTGRASMLIEDDGTGMTKQQLLGNWMVLGTDNKLSQERSSTKGRVLIGEKGLGRLGLDRLCEKTIVQTFTSKRKKGIELEVDWKKYENTNERLETIKHDLFEIPKTITDFRSNVEVTKGSGTRLLLIGLKDKWILEDLLLLRRDLSLLVSPFGGEDDFSIYLDSGMPDPLVDGEIESSRLLDAAEWKLSSKIDAKNRITHNLTSFSGAKFSFSESWSDVFVSDPKSKPECGPLQFEMYFYPHKGVKELDLRVAQIAGYLKANQGIRIYRDNFRVKPYGEPSGEGDWLTLALRRVQNPQGVRAPGLWKVGYNQVVGAAFLTRAKNSALLDQTNREGIVEGTAFFDLRKFCLHAIEFFETRRQAYEKSQIRRTKFEEAKEEADLTTKAAKKAITELEENVAHVVDELTKRKLPNIERLRDSLVSSTEQVRSAVVEADDAQHQLTEASEEQQLEFDQQKDTLGNLASLGILTATFGHETLGHSNLVLNNSILLNQNLESILDKLNNGTRDEIKSNLSNIEHGARRIETFAEFTLKNVRRDKRKRKQLYLDKLIKDVISSFKGSLEVDRGIEIVIENPDKITPFRAFRIDWESILVNLITNSKWALEDTPRNKRKIRIKLKEDKNQITLSFADSGIGIEAGTIDRIFEPTFSTKRNKRGDVIGTGMGLAIVENLVSGYGGRINVEAASDLGGAQFHILIPFKEVVTRR